VKCLLGAAKPVLGFNLSASPSAASFSLLGLPFAFPCSPLCPQSFLLAAMKMLWAVRCLLGPSGPASNPGLILAAIQGAISYTVSMIRSRCKIARLRLGLDVRCGVSRCHVRWLGLKAFHTVLKRWVRHGSYSCNITLPQQQLVVTLAARV
jgi:hypothetical protein